MQPLPECDACDRTARFEARSVIDGVSLSLCPGCLHTFGKHLGPIIVTMLGLTEQEKQEHKEHDETYAI